MKQAKRKRQEEYVRRKAEEEERKREKKLAEKRSMQEHKQRVKGASPVSEQYMLRIRIPCCERTLSHCTNRSSDEGFAGLCGNVSNALMADCPRMSMAAIRRTMSCV